MLCLSLSLCSDPSRLSPHSTPLFSPPPRRRAAATRAAVSSSHSNPRILKPNRRSPYGRIATPYDDDDDEEDFYSDEGESDEDESQLSDEDYSDVEESGGAKLSKENRIKLNSSITEKRSVKKRLSKKGWEDRSSNSGRTLELAYNSTGLKTNKSTTKNANTQNDNYTPNMPSEMDNVDRNAKTMPRKGTFTESRSQRLTEELDFDRKWFPLIDYLSTFGLKESHFLAIYERHMPCLQLNLLSAQERLEFLISVGVKPRDIKRILVRQPQILEYTVENNLKSHVSFLLSIGIPHSRIGQVITAAPSLFSYSVEHSLKPTVRYLIEEVGIKEGDVSKVVQLSPQILVQRLDNSWTSRLYFLSKELGAPRENIVKMVTKHPQLLHYSIEDGILPRINFLRSIGMRNADILKVITSLTQVLSLSLEGNLKPKYLYLVNELKNEVQSLTKYPTYLSLSLDQRIRPRHRFLVSLKKAPKGPFPLSSFVPTDESFCQQWAGTSVEKYLAFRQSLLLTNFAKKYERKR